MPDSTLFEAYEYLLLETEQRAAWLLNTFGKKLVQRFVADFKNITPNQCIDIIGQGHLPDEGTTEEEHAQVEQELAKKIIAYFMGIDPSPNKIYARWIVSRYLDKKKPQRLEDINELLTRTLDYFQQAARARRINGNIDEYKTFTDLYAAVEPFILGQRETSGKKDKKNKRDTSVDTRVQRLWDNDPMLEQAEVIYDSDNYLILVPKTHAASCYFGAKTNWCTTVENDHLFNSYSEQSPLYIILRRSDAKKWQFHFSTGQFCDERDDPINVNQWVEENEEAFHGLGPEKFFPLTFEADYAGRKLSIKWFTKEMLETFPTETLVRTVEKKADLKALPERAKNDPELLRLLCARFLNAARPIPLAKYITAEGPKEWAGVLAAVAKKWAKSEIVDKLLAEYPMLLMLLPEGAQTEGRKFITASNPSVPSRCEEFVPKPWPDSVSKIHYSEVVEPAKQIPEQFRTDAIMRHSFVRYPEGMQDAPNWATLEMVRNCADYLRNDGWGTATFVQHLPEQFRRDPQIAKTLLNSIREFKGVANAEQRDAFIASLSTLAEEVWPKNAPVLKQRMLEVAPDFFKLPKHYQTQSVMDKWLPEHPRELPKLPAEWVTKRAVTDTIMPWLRQDDFPSHILRDCDPAIVRPEWIEKAMRSTEQFHLDSHWNGIPAKFVTRSLAEQFIGTGEVPFNDPLWAKEDFTPLNMAKRFAKVNWKHMVQNKTKYGMSQVEELNKPGFEKLVAELPEFVDKRQAARSAIIAAPVAVIGFDKKYLDASVLSAFAQWFIKHPHDRRLYSFSSEAKDAFKCFPKSAYSVDSIPALVELRFVDRAPEHLISDEAIVKSLQVNYEEKGVNWDKVTVPLLLKAIAGKARDVAYKMRKCPRKDLLTNVEVANAFIDAFNAQSDTSSVLNLNTDSFRQVYEPQDRRANWTAEQYERCAGNPIHLDEIPQKFWTDKVVERALRTRPQDISLVDDPAEFMNKFNIKYTGERRHLASLAEGVVPLPDGNWANASSLPKHKVKGSKGSYAITAIAPRGHVLFIFDDKGKVVNAILSGCVPRTGYSTIELLASYFTRDTDYHKKEPAIKAMFPYRLLIGDAFEKFPSELADVRRSNHKSPFESLLIYDSGDSYRCVEDMPRKQLGGLTYCKAGDKWKGGNYYFFDGDSKRVLGNILMREDGRGVAVEEFFPGKDMKALLDRSKDITEWLSDERTVSGQSKAFKETDLYKKIGIRGPGGYEWYCLLDQCIVTDGKLRLWRCETDKGVRYSVTDDDIGMLILAKMLKGGEFTYDVIAYGEPFQSRRDAIQKILTKANTN